MKPCRKCGLLKPEADFPPKGRWLAGDCRACRAEYQHLRYLRDKARYMEGARRRKQRMLALMRQAKERPCADCGQQFPYYVMDFDHLPGKRKHKLSMSDLAMLKSKAAFLEEIDKCDVVCANCHRIRTHQRKLEEMQTLL
jgi:hypothetical protein